MYIGTSEEPAAATAQPTAKKKVGNGWLVYGFFLFVYLLTANGKIATSDGVVVLAVTESSEGRLVF